MGNKFWPKIILMFGEIIPKIKMFQLCKISDFLIINNKIKINGLLNNLLKSLLEKDTMLKTWNLAKIKIM